MFRFLKIVIFALSIASLFGCVGAAVESVRMADSKFQREQYREQADEGDMEAQYQVGVSYCCTPGDSDKGFYNNQLSTEYLCKAAIQGHGAAALMLGKIHSGDRVDGVRIIRRAATFAVGSKNKNLEVAAYWLTLAEKLGQEEASELLADMPVQDSTQYDSPENTPCTMKQVYGN